MPRDIQSIVRPWDGKIISEPGIVSGVPMGFYHSQCCIGPSVSSSQIRTVEKRSLKHAYKDWSGNPNREPPEDKPHFGFGRYVHDVAAEDHEALAKNFSIRPDKWDSWRTKDAKAWRAQEILDGRSVMTPEDVVAAQGLIAELQAHPTIRAGILQGLVEHSIFWIDADTGIWCKSRPDVIPVDSGMVVDLKTTTDASPAAVRRAIGEWSYHIQLGMVHEGLMSFGYLMEEFVLLFIEKEDPWGINHKPLPSHDIDYGRRQLRRTLDRWKVALDTGEWEGYQDDEVEGGLPDWYRKRLAWEAEHKLLPEVSNPLSTPTEEEGV